MPKRTRRYENDLVESLKDPKEAAAYLNVHCRMIAKILRVIPLGPKRCCPSAWNGKSS
jgi:hypothetical protein